MRMYAGQYPGSGGTGSLGSVPWARTEAVAERPELLANHWPQLLWWTERQAPNVNIGGLCIAGRSTSASGTRPSRPATFFPLSGIFIASRSRFAFPLRFPWEGSRSCRSAAA